MSWDTPFVCCAAWALVGGVTGFVNVWLLVRTVRLMDPNLRTGSVGVMVAGYLLRYILTGGVLLLAVRQGIGPALAAVAGMWVARWWAVHLGRSGSAIGTRLQTRLD